MQCVEVASLPLSFEDRQSSREVDHSNFFSDLILIYSGPVRPDDVPDVLAADGAEPSAAPLPLLHGAPVAHAHVPEPVDGTVHRLFAAHHALRPDPSHCLSLSLPSLMPCRS